MCVYVLREKVLEMEKSNIEAVYVFLTETCIWSVFNANSMSP